MKYTNDEAFNAGNYISVNRDLIKTFGVESAFLISYILDARGSPLAVEYMKTHDGFFFMTHDRVERELGYLEKKQKAMMDTLVGLGVLETRNIGTPQKRHLRVNTTELIALVNTKVEKTPVVATPTITKTPDEYYATISSKIYEGFDSFKTVIDNMDKKIAMPLYVFTRVMGQVHGIKVQWTAALFGRFKIAIKPHSSNMDYARLASIVKDNRFKGSDNLMGGFMQASKSAGTNHPSKRVMDPTKLDCWDSIKGGASESLGRSYSR